MNYIRENAPLLLSPTFWGLTLTGLFATAELYAWVDPELMKIVYTWLLGVTGVNIVWKTGQKISGQ